MREIWANSVNTIVMATGEEDLLNSFLRSDSLFKLPVAEVQHARLRAFGLIADESSLTESLWMSDAVTTWNEDSSDWDEAEPRIQSQETAFNETTPLIKDQQQSTDTSPRSETDEEIARDEVKTRLESVRPVGREVIEAEEQKLVMSFDTCEFLSSRNVLKLSLQASKKLPLKKRTHGYSGRILTGTLWTII